MAIHLCTTTVCRQTHEYWAEHMQIFRENEIELYISLFGASTMRVIRMKLIYFHFGLRSKMVVSICHQTRCQASANLWPLIQSSWGTTRKIYFECLILLNLQKKNEKRMSEKMPKQIAEHSEKLAWWKISAKNDVNWSVFDGVHAARMPFQ